MYPAEKNYASIRNGFARIESLILPFLYQIAQLRLSLFP